MTSKHRYHQQTTLTKQHCIIHVHV